MECMCVLNVDMNCSPGLSINYVKFFKQKYFSATKYSHNSPWPAFTQTYHQDSVSKYEERPGALKVETSFKNNQVQTKPLIQKQPPSWLKSNQCMAMISSQGSTCSYLSLMMLQVSCGKCGNGLGHEFLGDGPKGQSRFWIFSHSLKFRAASNKTDAQDAQDLADGTKCWN